MKILNHMATRTVFCNGDNILNSEEFYKNYISCDEYEVCNEKFSSKREELKCFEYLYASVSP